MMQLAVTMTYATDGIILDVQTWIPRVYTPAQIAKMLWICKYC